MTERPGQRRFQLSGEERELAARARLRPYRPTDVLRSALRSPQLIPDIARAATRGAVNGIREHGGILWTVDADRVRRVVPDAAMGATAHGLDAFMEVLSPLLTPETRALEIGSGGGRVSDRTAPFVRELVCADISSALLAEARANLARHDNVSFVKTNGFTLAPLPDASFDVVLSHDVLLQLEPNPVLALIDEIRRVLRPAGACILSFYTVDRPEWGRTQLELVGAAARDGRFGVSQPRPYTEESIDRLLEIAGFAPSERQYAQTDDPAEQAHYVVVGRR